MDFNIVSFIFFLRNTFGLVFTPYATMRKISIQKESGSILLIFFLAIVYFLISQSVRSWIVGLCGAIALYGESILFISILPSSSTFIDRLKRIVRTWSYSLIPTLLWFYATLFLYYVIPPPRTSSLLGILFSTVYIAFSASLLIWKCILIYLVIRFSLRVQIYRVIYYILLYLAVSGPLWILFYMSGISRVPFV